MDPRFDYMQDVTRRHFLSQLSMGVGGRALGSLLGQDFARAASVGPDPSLPPNPMAAKPPHFAPRAKRVIYIHMAGSPPQQDLLDFKPKLNELNGQPCPEEMIKGERFAFIRGHPTVLGSPYTFARHGSSGAWVSNLLPHFTQIVDDIPSEPSGKFRWVICQLQHSYRVDWES